MSHISAYLHLPYDSKPKVYMGETKLNIVKGEKGLFALTDIEEDKPVVIYYGDILKQDDIFNTYKEDKEKYLKISPYLRGNCENMVINGLNAKEHENPNFLGVYVNDRWSLPKIAKDDLKSAKAKKEYNKYLSMMQKANLYAKETTDYPVYYSKRAIKKDEELYISYGIGYWLSKNGIEPDELYDLKQSMGNNSYLL
jgi:hypothetical protein